MPRRATKEEGMADRILVVDDEEDFRELLAYNLRLKGYEVILASNGLQSLAGQSDSAPNDPAGCDDARNQRLLRL